MASVFQFLQQSTVQTLGVVLVLQVLLRLTNRVQARDSGAVLVVGVAAAIAAIVQTVTGSVDWVSAERFAGVAALLLSALAAIQVGLSLVFQFLLPLVGLRVPRIVQDLCLAALSVGGALFWIGEQGVDPSRLFTTSAILTAVIAFAMQDTLGNILGGVVLQLDNSLKIGDVVRVDDASGTVVDVRWRYTAIETSDRETVVIPNSWLMKNRFRVLRARPNEPLLVRRTLYFNVDPQVAPGAVMQVLNEAVANSGVPTVSSFKTGNTVLLEVTAGYCRYALRYWLEDPDADVPTDSQLRTHVHAALQRAGIALGAVQEVHVQRDGQAQLAQQHSQWQELRHHALAGCSLFAALGQAQRDSIVQHLHDAPFAKGSFMARQGEPAHCMYLIVRGRARVVATLDGVSTDIAVLEAGDYFGEMGLLTGAPRTADVVALEDMQCLRLDKDGFATVLQQHPQVAADVAHGLEARRGDHLDRVRLAQENTAAPRQGELLQRLRQFFGMA